MSGFTEGSGSGKGREFRGPIKKVRKVAEAEFSGGYSKGKQVGREKKE